jgi:hypothetical protein
LYGEVYLLGDFNVDLLDPGHSLFPRFLDFLLDAFVPVRGIKVIKKDRLCILCRLCVRNWFDESVELAINKRDAAYKVWHNNITRIRGNRLRILYVRKRRYADGLVERKYGGFVSVNLDSTLKIIYR